jgi:hypothetical protein
MESTLLIHMLQSALRVVSAVICIKFSVVTWLVSSVWKCSKICQAQLCVCYGICDWRLSPWLPCCIKASGLLSGVILGRKPTFRAFFRMIRPEEGTNISPETLVSYQEWRRVITQKLLYNMIWYFLILDMVFVNCSWFFHPMAVVSKLVHK